MTALGGLAQNYWHLLIARIGVGVGEAGSNPPSHSIIADLYAPHERATAMGVFGMGVGAGILLGFLAGGWINQWFGWREAFFVVGLPGLLIALVVRFTVKEPERGASEGLKAEGDAPFMDVIRFRDRAQPVVLGGSCCAFVGYALVLWLPAFFVRAHGLGTGEIGTAFAIIAGVLGALGVLATGGWRPPRVARRGLAHAYPRDRLDAGDAPAHRDGCCRLTLVRFCAVHRSRDRGQFHVGPTFATIQSRRSKNAPLLRRSICSSRTSSDSASGRCT